MNRYTIYCTPEQTKKALELGAQIYTAPYFPVLIYEVKNFFVKDDTCYYFPTAEQMIGWLEDNGFNFEVTRDYTSLEHDTMYTIGMYAMPRKEATLIAIDAALDMLEYLTNNKSK